MALGLPRFAVIQSHEPPKNYLRYIREDGGSHGTLQFSGEEIMSPYAKFEIETAKTTPAGNENGFVHIRCCYNNKYWVAKSSSDPCIIAGADEPNEDQSQWSCTLFEPIRRQLRGDLFRNIQMDDEEEGSTNTTVIFRHVQLRDYLVYPVDSGGQIRACMTAQLKSLSNSFAVFHIIDWESLLMLPKHVALKGDNGRYLSARWIERHQYLQFASCDKGDPTVGNQVFVNEDGSVRIKNDHFGKFWRRSPNWIWADSDDTTTANLDTLFYPVKVGDNVVALRNLGNDKFCKRLTTEGKRDCLNAGVDMISKEARLVVEELVVSREIYNVNFHLLDARIYNQSIVTMVTKTATNDTQESNTATLNFLRNETKSSTWNGSVSFKLGVKTSIQTGIPFIVEGKVEVSAEFTGSYQWGETVSTENQVETEYTISAPPRSKVTVSLLATQGSCDVPYSYTQRDTLMNGGQIIHNFDDGVYTGINSFNFFYQTKQEKL
ncbi:hypothetical protein RHSIM_Rhsim05G0010000 [Rhododendron simsii]|uniref:Agglutinin domain-containing protein n=1 Tax=Rhododendron simsii TaxID=118357 RepID=A0A834H0A7_RHOSS|nr:hypothetical protein RHSIM_Rhsim05G0010000 [Rhododendron simsii]